MKKRFVCSIPILHFRGELTIQHYVPFWNKFQKCRDFKGDFNGSYKEMHEALLLFEEYCDEHHSALGDLDFSEEISAILQTFELKQTYDFAVCHQNDLQKFFPEEEADYWFCWNFRDISWNFPDGYRGYILI